MKYFGVHTDSELEKIFPLMKELREHLDFKQFIFLFREAKKTANYRLLAFKDDHDKVVALMGYRIISDFVHGKHLYIDDLLVSSQYRSQGYGEKILKISEEIAKENGCDNLRLCTGVQNERGKKFYEDNDWKLRAVAYKKKI